MIIPITMSGPLHNVEMLGDVAIVTLNLDKLSHADNEEVMKGFDTIVKEGRKKIILDLTGTYYISSLILASFVYMQKKVQDSGGNLIFCNMKARVAEIVAQTNLDKIFKIVDSRETAIQEFKPPVTIWPLKSK